ncbi:MAG: DUF3795 domain-containing protein [Candidatus Bathyarchaeota archaeon]
MTVKEIGCCGAYCRTCLNWQKEKYPNKRTCRGCKLGYESENRDLSKSKCKIKVCCFVEKQLETCVDCQDYPCKLLETFWNKKGWKYNQYKKQLEYIKQNGYTKYLDIADTWKKAHGKLTH